MAEELSRQVDDGAGEADEILAFFVHELRNPLAVIKGYAGALEDSEPAPDPGLVAASVGAIKRAVGTLDSLVSSLSDAAPLFGQDIELELEEILTSLLVEETVADLRTLSNGRLLQISIEDDAVIRVDQVRIRQVLMNLISNALKFSPPRSVVKIVVSRTSGHIRICVIDEGPGIPEERTGELFRKFSRLGSSKDGTGLGLYISRSIALAHGGDLRLRDADEGCHFSLTLPIEESPRSAS